MSKEKIEKMMRDELGTLDEDDMEVVEITNDFEETYKKILMLL